MPNVGGVQYPYTPRGVAAAQQAERQIGKMGPAFGGWGGLVGDPLMSPGLLELVRQRQQPTFRDVSHRPEQSTPNPASQRPTGRNYLQDLLQFKALQEMMQSQAGIADQYQPTSIMPGTGIKQNWQTDAFGNVVTNQFGNPATQQPVQSQPTANFGQLIGRAPWWLGSSAQRPITQTPRGQAIRTTPNTPQGNPTGQPAQQPTFSSVSHRPQQPTFSSISHRPKQPTFSSVSHRPTP